MVKWLHLTGEVDKSVRVHVKFSPDLTYQKVLKSVNFDRVIQKNKKVDVFLGGGARCNFPVDFFMLTGTGLFLDFFQTTAWDLFSTVRQLVCSLI